MTKRRSSLLRHELSRAAQRAGQLRKIACSGWLLDAERAALAAGQPGNAYDGRPGAYPDLAARLCADGLRYVERWPADAAAYLAWALAYLEVAAADLDGCEPLSLCVEHGKARAWVDRLGMEAA